MSIVITQLVIKSSRITAIKKFLFTEIKVILKDLY